MPFVLDASATLACCLRDESTAWSVALLERLRNGDTANVPAHWLTEVGNGLLSALRRTRITLADIVAIHEDLKQLPIQIEPTALIASLDGILQAAVKHNLTVYDAAYLDLASKLQYPLATLDSDLRNAAASVGIQLI